MTARATLVKDLRNAALVALLVGCSDPSGCGRNSATLPLDGGEAPPPSAEKLPNAPGLRAPEFTKARCSSRVLATKLGAFQEAGRLAAKGSGFVLPILRTEREAEIVLLDEAFALERTLWKGAASDVPEVVSLRDRTLVSIGASSGAPVVRVLQGDKLVAPPNAELRAVADFIAGGAHTTTVAETQVQWVPSKEQDAGIDPSHRVERAAEAPLESVHIRWLRGASTDAGARVPQTLLLGRAGAVDLVPTSEDRVLLLYTDARAAHGHGGSLRVASTDRGKAPRILVASRVMPEFAALFVANGGNWAFFSLGTGALALLPFDESTDALLPSREPELERLALLGSVPAKEGLALLASDLESGHLHLVQCHR